MNHKTLFTAGCFAMLQAGAADTAAAQGSSAARTQEITRAGTQAATAGPADFFTGRVRVEPVWPADDHLNASGSMVTFEPGARSAWHTHPAGQRLVVMSGAGLTQEWGKPVQMLRPGDVVRCPPGVKHWHGAGLTTAMSHLAVTGTLEGKGVHWMEKVSDEQYGAGAAIAVSKGAPAMTTPALTPRQRSIPTIAAATAVGDMPRLATALNQGLDDGLTVSEAKEILVHLYAYAGFPRSLNAIGELMKVLEARRQRGVQDPPGRESGPVPSGPALLALGTANQTKLSGAPVKGALFEFAPAIDQYLKAHLFGDLFARDNLDWQSRELATLGALAALPGAESQLSSHVRFAMNVGLTEPQLKQVSGLLDEAGQADAARRAAAAVARPPGTSP